MLLQAQQRTEKAEPLFKQALDIREKKLGRDHLDTVATREQLASLHRAEAPSSEVGVADAPIPDTGESSRDRESPAVAMQTPPAMLHEENPVRLNGAALKAANEFRFAEAEQLFKRAIEIWRNRSDSRNTAISTYNLASAVYVRQARWSAAESALHQSMHLWETIRPRDDRQIALCLNDLGEVYKGQAMYSEAETAHKKALAIRQRILPGDPCVAQSTNNLGELYRTIGRHREAEPLYSQSQAIWEKNFGKEHLEVAGSLNNQALLHNAAGRHREAEELFKRTLAILEKQPGKSGPQAAWTIGNLAGSYRAQGRCAEAEPLYMRSLDILKQIFDDKHPQVAQSLNDLGTLYCGMALYSKAEESYKQALSILEKALDSGHPQVAIAVNNLAYLYRIQGRCDEAGPLYERALAILEKNFGPGHPHISGGLGNLATVYIKQKRHTEAEPLLDRAIKMVQNSPANSSFQSKAALFSERATVYWETGRRELAITDLEEAIRLTELLRKHASGTDIQRADFYARHINVFEMMVAWQAELGGFEEAFLAIERSRAQGLQDLMRSNGVDLLEGVPVETASRLLRAESDAQAEVAALQKKFKQLHARTDSGAKEKLESAKRLSTALGQARERLVQAWADLKNASPAYRLVVTEDREPVGWETLRNEFDESGTLGLQYLLGREMGSLLVYGGGEEPLLTNLELNETQAKSLRCEAGPLTSARTQEILLGDDDKRGLLQKLTSLGSITRDGRPKKEMIEQLNTLWAVLVPDKALRERLTDSESFERLLILPDGVLSRLPFEALVVERDPVNPEYLLERGPVTMYAPSATVFHNLKHRKIEKSSGKTLTTGNPIYEGSDVPGNRATASDELDTAGRFARFGGLTTLPWTEHEIHWIAESCEENGLPVLCLEQETASESMVRANVRGCSLVHLACHGLADDSHGNLFGALALTPVDSGNPSDDGLLTVAEMFDLNLDACELAILSACDTNVGPNQRGEGTWSMCRGMLTSGARRVVTTDWQVADGASAHLAYALVYYIQDPEDEGRDYAESLRDARLSIRHHEENPQWRHPYFWAPFVLMGPQ